jgi:uncharacterized protein (TIGR02246 family)
MMKGNAMRAQLLRFLALAAMVFGLAALDGLAGQQKGDAKEGDAIAKRAEAFIEAFQKGDAKALAAFWTADGDYIDQTGRRLKGRDAIEKAFREMFTEHKGLKLLIDSEALRFVTPDVAIEDGTTEVLPADGGPPTRARYTIIHVKKDGYWLLSSVRNSPPLPPASYEHLRGLEWAIGDWAGKSDKGEVEKLSFAWAENQSFIVGTFSTTSRNVAVSSAKQWIGWDPLTKQVRSWMFDATGGFGEGSWIGDGKKWVVKTNYVLPEGKKATATFIVAPVDADTISLQARDRSVDGNKLPDTKEIKLNRVK